MPRKRQTRTHDRRPEPVAGMLRRKPSLAGAKTQQTRPLKPAPVQGSQKGRNRWEFFQQFRRSLLG